MLETYRSEFPHTVLGYSGHELGELFFHFEGNELGKIVEIFHYIQIWKFLFTNYINKFIIILQI